MTLPERVLRLLATVDPDRAKAIVKLVEMMLEASEKSRNLVEMVPVSPAKAFILVANSRLLRGIPWLRLVEVAPARYLLSLLPGTSIEKLEVTLSDLLDAVPASEPVERDLLESLRHCLRGPRRHQTVTKEEILFVAVEPGKDRSHPTRKTTPALDRVRGRN